MVGKFNRHILLLLDNAGGHNVTEEVKRKLTHVKLEYFDPNVTSHIQPLDMGIIRSFKAYYRKALVKFCLKAIETKGEIIMPSLKDAIIMIKNSWKQVNNFFIIFNINACLYNIINKGDKRYNS